MKAKADNGVPLSGEVGQMTVPWLFQALSAGSKTGTAAFEYVQEGTAEKVLKKVYFSNGDIAFASSNLEAERLGDRLLKAGTLTQAQFDASTELIKQTGKRQGAILVELGFIKPHELVEGVREQVRHILQSLFSVRLGTYRFTEGPLPLADIIPLQMSTGNVILECVHAMPWEAVRKAMPSPTAVLRPATDPKNLFQDAQLSADERSVLALVDGQRRIEQICGLSGIGDFNALRAIHLLLALRMAEPGELKADEAERTREEAKAPPEPDLVVTREMVIEAHGKLASTDHYEALHIDENATLPQIKRAYFRMAKAYHPDRHFDPAMADVKNKLEDLFHSVHQAYEVLSNPEKRAEYDRAPRSRPAPQQPAPGEATTGEYVEKHAEGYDEQYKEKAERAAQWYQKGVKEFKTGNFWGAAESLAWATRLDPIKAPYFFYYGMCLSFIPRRRHEAEENLQKAIEIDPSKIEFHIELSNLYLKAGLKMKSLAVLKAAAERLPASEKVKEAVIAAEAGQVYATLSKTGSSEREEEAATGKMTAAAAKAAERYNAAAKEFKVGNFPAAAEAFADAARLDPAKALYHYYLGLSLSRVQRRQADAEPSLRRALELDPSKHEYHLALGNFYLRNGLKAKALGVLNNALLRFPGVEKIRDAVVAAGGSVGAAEEAAQEKKGGVFSKLFKGPK